MLKQIRLHDKFYYLGLTPSSHRYLEQFMLLKPPHTSVPSHIAIMALRPRQHGLLWKGLEPTWTVIPSLVMLEELATRHLPDGFPKSEIVVEFFAEGAFNKLYTISSPHSPQEYILRVALPVEPFYKTESEAATLAYVRKYTTLPVPEVIAYDSSSENELGFEWMLLKKIGGVPVSEIWESSKFSSKVQLTVQISDLQKELRLLQFGQVGSLYFSTVKSQVNGRIIFTQARNKDGNLDIDSDFVIGRMVSPWFFRDKRVWLPADRGPFSSSSDMMMAKIQIQIERLKNLSPSPDDEYYTETDEDLVEDQEKVLDICHTLKELVPLYFPTFKVKERNLLYHDDLSARNILINPESFRITGILDWESVSIRPAWECYDYPYFLKGIECTKPPPKGTPGIDEDDLIDMRQEWEKVRLRFIYRWLGLVRDTEEAFCGLHKTISSSDVISLMRDFSFVNETLSEDDDISRRKQFSHCLENIEDRWTATRYWLDNQDHATRSKEHQGRIDAG